MLLRLRTAEDSCITLRNEMLGLEAPINAALGSDWVSDKTERNYIQCECIITVYTCVAWYHFVHMYVSHDILSVHMFLGILASRHAAARWLISSIIYNLNLLGAALHNHNFQVH